MEDQGGSVRRPTQITNPHHDFLLAEARIHSLQPPKGVGADLVDSTALLAGNLAKISAGARELVNTVQSARNKRCSESSGA